MLNELFKLASTSYQEYICKIELKMNVYLKFTILFYSTYQYRLKQLFQTVRSFV